MVAAASPPAIGEVWKGFLASDRPDPRVLQTVIAGLVALNVVTRRLAGEGYAAESWPAVGLAVVLGATAVSYLVPWSRVPLWAFAALPVIDMLALGLTRLGANGSGPSLVVVLPAVWLGWQFGRRGVAVAVVLVALFQALPGLIYHGISVVTVSRAGLLPLVAAAAAMAVTLGLETLRARTREAEERGDELGRALVEMKRQKELNQTVLDTVDIGMVLLGPDGSYQAQNRQHRAFVTMSFPEGHEGRAGELGEVFDEHGTRRLAREEMASERAMRGEEFEDQRVWVGDPAHRRALSVSARVMCDADGRLTGAALAYKDITDLLSALQVKDEFVATVSHELRTPLTSIIGYVDLLQERDDLADQAERQLAVVHRNGERLLRLVDDLLDTAQLAGGGNGLSLAICDLPALVRDAVAAAQPAAMAAGVTISARLPERMPVRIDPERIGQVLDNLLSNAVQYNRPEGRVRVELTRDGEDARVEIRDTGAGLLPDELEQLFTRFYRARHAVDHAIPGAGLGLCLSKAIVEAHSGRIDIESEADVGTVVRFRVPLLVPPADPAAALAPDPGVGPATPPGIAPGHG